MPRPPRRRAGEGYFLSVVAELLEGPTPKLELVEISLSVADGRVRDEVEPRGCAVVRRFGVGGRLQVKLAVVHLSGLQVLVQRLDGLPTFEEGRLNARADEAARQEIGRVAVAGPADDQNVLARSLPGLLESLEHAGPDAVALGVNPGDLILLRRDQLRSNFISLLLHEAGGLLLDHLKLALHRFGEGLGAVSASRIAGREREDHALAALHPSRLRAGVEQHLRRRLRVQEVVNAGVSRPELLGSRNRILVGEDDGFSRFR